jgi:hypothetical protein
LLDFFVLARGRDTGVGAVVDVAAATAGVETEPGGEACERCETEVPDACGEALAAVGSVVGEATGSVSTDTVSTVFESTGFGGSTAGTCSEIAGVAGGATAAGEASLCVDPRFHIAMPTMATRTTAAPTPPPTTATLRPADPAVVRPTGGIVPADTCVSATCGD